MAKENVFIQPDWSQEDVTAIFERLNDGSSLTQAQLIVLHDSLASLWRRPYKEFRRDYCMIACVAIQKLIASFGPSEAEGQFTERCRHIQWDLAPDCAERQGDVALRQ